MKNGTGSIERKWIVGFKRRDKMYKYGYRLRPPALGTQPKGFVEIEDDIGTDEYWGYVVYSRKLTEKEMDQYDLDYLGEDD